MRKYLFLLIILSYSCNTKKSVSTKSKIDYVSDSVTITQDTSTVYVDKTVDSVMGRKDSSVTVTKQTDFYEDGTVKTIVESFVITLSEFNFKGLDMDKTKLSFNTITTTHHTDSLESISQEQLISDTDSRLIQGSEWFYVVGALVLVTVFFIIIKKRH